MVDTQTQNKNRVFCVLECVLECGYQLVFIFKVIAVVVLRRSKGIVVNDVGSVSIIIHELVLLVRSLR